MPADSDPAVLRVVDLGRMAYEAAMLRQREVHGAVVAGEKPQTLLLVEHDPVITISRRRSAPDHLLADAPTRAALGIDVQPTDRGGDITYHGPGQVVAYPVLRLGPLRLNVGRYMRMLEHVVIDTVRTFGVEAYRDPEATGVWVDQPGHPLPAKLCAIGVRVSRNVTMHGLALNVTTDLEHFNTIVPCGLPDRGVTSLERLLGDAAPTMGEVKAAVSETLLGQIRARARQSGSAN